MTVLLHFYIEIATALFYYIIYNRIKYNLLDLTGRHNVSVPSG